MIKTTCEIKFAKFNSRALFPRGPTWHLFARAIIKGDYHHTHFLVSLTHPGPGGFLTLSPMPPSLLLTELVAQVNMPHNGPTQAELSEPFRGRQGILTGKRMAIEETILPTSSAKGPPNQGCVEVTHMGGTLGTPPSTHQGCSLGGG